VSTSCYSFVKHLARSGICSINFTKRSISWNVRPESPLMRTLRASTLVHQAGADMRVPSLCLDLSTCNHYHILQLICALWKLPITLYGCLCVALVVLVTIVSPCIQASRASGILKAVSDETFQMARNTSRFIEENNLVLITRSDYIHILRLVFDDS
jgi:hypothetical protein